MAAADQRNLITKASIAKIAAEMGNDRRENVRKLAQAHDVSARMVYAALKEVHQVCEQMVFHGNEEGEIQDV